jgi:hypothetical protein
LYSIVTSKVTNESKERSNDDKEDTGGGSKNKQVAIDGMDIVTCNDGQGAMLFSRAPMEEESAQASKEERKTEEDSNAGTTSKSADLSRKEEAKEVLHLTAKRKKATTLLQLDSEENASNDSNFTEDDLSVRSDNLDLQLSNYKSDAQEVSSGEFDARHIKKYVTPKMFKHALWNKAEPSAGAMQICLEIIKEELVGQIAGVPAPVFPRAAN